MAALISRETLKSRLGEAGLLLIDLRLAADGGREAYRAGHVPGAVYSDYAADGWRQKVGNAPGLLPDADHLASLFGKLGIGPKTDVVLLPLGNSANDFGASARAYWTLKQAGHLAVSILDGGTQGWVKAGLPVEAGENAPKATTPYPLCPQPALRRRADEVEAALKAHSATLVDARSPSYFIGAEKAAEAKRAGRIPGAVNAEHARAFDAATGALLPPEKLTPLYAEVPPGPVISYCNTGHTAALNWFVLSEVLGRPDVSLYDGSMTDWTQDDSRPVDAG
ncbi:MAG: sulfurtransferase [Beijerinckiaceae bacterium]|jgi:thiosulfate/3-mercaptopyruvate sulfurtransferase|nr:sulfurtransferase [Beijerinckiaceae bacterium]